MAVTVHIDQKAIDKAFANMMPDKSTHRTAIRKAGVAVSLMIQHTLRQQGKDYYDAAADATTMQEEADGVSISIAWPGIGMHWLGTQGYLGRPLTATGRTSEITGKPIKNLAIPTENAPRGHGGTRSIYSAGFRMEDLQFVPSRNGGRNGNVTGVLVLKTAQSTTGQKASKKLFKNGVKTGDVLYILCREVTIPPTPGILPTLDEMANGAAEAYLTQLGKKHQETVS